MPDGRLIYALLGPVRGIGPMRARHFVHAAAVGACVFLAAASSSCGTNDRCEDASTIGIDEAIEQRDDRSPMRIRGYGHASGGETRLCESLSSSVPPSCMGASLRLGRSLSERTGELQRVGNVEWTSEEIEILGVVRGETIVSVGCA